MSKGKCYHIWAHRKACRSPGPVESTPFASARHQHAPSLRRPLLTPSSPTAVQDWCELSLPSSPLILVMSWQEGGLLWHGWPPTPPPPPSLLLPSLPSSQVMTLSFGEGDISASRQGGGAGPAKAGRSLGLPGLPHHPLLSGSQGNASFLLGRWMYYSIAKALKTGADQRAL